LVRWIGRNRHFELFAVPGDDGERGGARVGESASNSAGLFSFRIAVLAPFHSTTWLVVPLRSGIGSFRTEVFQKLPEPDSDWSAEDRMLWLRTAANIFDLAYKEDGVSPFPARADRSPRTLDE
jgi:hypothetical protein